MTYLPAVRPEKQPRTAPVSITVDPAYLEDLLECLAELQTPIDPKIFHGPETIVQFRIADSEAPQVRKALRLAGFHRVS